MNKQKTKNTILLNRSILGWGWYKDTNTARIFIHLLLRVNWKDDYVNGIEIKRGQLLTSLESLKYETGMTTQSIRTCLNKLIKTNELTSKSTNKYRIITVCKYDEYQYTNKQVNKHSNKPLTITATTNKELNLLNQYNPLNIKHYDNLKLNELFIDFIKLRKSLKAVNSERAINGVLNILKPYDDKTKIEMINNSIVGSWKTVYPLQGTKSKSTKINDGRYGEH